MMADILISIVAAVGFGLTGIYVAVARRHKPTWKAGVIGEPQWGSMDLLGP